MWDICLLQWKILQKKNKTKLKQKLKLFGVYFPAIHSKLYSETVTMSVVRVCLLLHVCFSTRTNWIQLWALFDYLPALFKDERPFRACELEQTTVMLKISSETNLRFVYKSFWVWLIRPRPIQQMTWTIGVNTSALFSQPHRLHWKTGLGSNLAKIEKPYEGFEVCSDLQAELFVFPYFKVKKKTIPKIIWRKEVLRQLPFLCCFFMERAEHHCKRFLSPETPKTPKQNYVSKLI